MFAAPPERHRHAARRIRFRPAASLVAGLSLGLVLVGGVAPDAPAPGAPLALRAQGTPVGPHGPVDPERGGPVDTTTLDRVVPGRVPLGHVHLDPMPRGVSLASPSDTRSLYARSGAVRTAGDGTTAASGTPAGASVVPGLDAHVTPSCTGTGTDGKRVQAMYVHERSTPSRYEQVLPLLRNEIANVDDTFAVSARKTGGDLRVRWVHDASCAPVILDVTVPDGSLGPDFDATISALDALGYHRRSRKYVAFADADQLCGIGTYYEDDAPTSNDNDGYAASYSRIDTNCWSTSESVAAHELTHNLGGVLASAPHHTSYGHCYDEWDLMCYDDGSGIPMRSVCAQDQAALLDCGDDDYFNTHPAASSYLATHWDTASSGFLEEMPATDPPSDAAPAASAWSGPAREPGRPVRLSATLRDAGSGAGLAGRPVHLEARWRGADRYVPVTADLVTDAAGHVVTTADATRAGSFRFTYAGDAEHAPSVSSSRYLKVPTRLAMRARPARHLVVGRLTTVDGRTLPRARLVLQERQRPGSRWRVVRRLRTDAHGRGHVRVRVRPHRRTSYRWVYRGQVDYLRARSGRVALRR